MLKNFLADHTQQIIELARTKVAARTSPVPTAAELENGVPVFLQQLIDELGHATTGDAVLGRSAAQNGGEMFAMGLSVAQVVRGYGDVCQAVTELADSLDAAITVEEFRQFNQCLDEATARAVTEYERQRDRASADAGAQRQGVLAHELRNRLGAATLAFNILRGGSVAIGGSIGSVVDRNLRAMQRLIDDSLAQVRLDAGVGGRRHILASELVDAVASEAIMAAEYRGLRLDVGPVAPGLDLDVDTQIVEAALSNLLQNAFKFTRPGSLVSLRVSATADRVSIAVEDECGGLPPGDVEDLFLPFEQKSANRTGLGLGLPGSRQGVEAMGGTIIVHDRPGQGCIFTIELPRMPSI